MATAEPFSSDLIDVEIAGAKIVHAKVVGDKIVGGEIVDGRVVAAKNDGRKTARARSIDVNNTQSEIIAAVVLCLAMLVVIHFW
jgi:hypothetical protein